jgi:hypothetical protein
VLGLWGCDTRSRAKPPATCTIAALVRRLIERSAVVTDERTPASRKVAPKNIAVITAHNDQVLAARKALSREGVDPDEITVSTANKIQCPIRPARSA